MERSMIPQVETSMQLILRGDKMLRRGFVVEVRLDFIKTAWQLAKGKAQELD